MLELGPEIKARTLVKRAIYDSLDAVARSHGRISSALAAAAAGAGPASTNCLVTGSTRTLRPSSVRAPNNREVARLSEHDIVVGPIAGDMDIRTADPTLEDCPVGLPETQFLVSLDSQRFEHFGWNP